MFLKFSSSIWKNHIINELYTVLIYAYILKGEKLEGIILSFKN